MMQSNDLPAMWPERKVSRSGAGRTAACAALALGAAAATWVALPASSFQAKSIVAVSEPTSPIAAILARTASDVAVSKSVMTRAAESLIGTGFAAPEPDVVERAALAAHLGGAKATGKTARLAAALPRLVSARPGETPGSLEILASTAEAERAVQVAAAVADALITEQEDTIAAGRRKRDLDIATRLDRLKVDADAARRRLVQLGGFESDPVQSLAAAASQTAKAQARVNTIRAIIASGTPPLSDRRDVPSTIETLQAAYLDLTRQLTKARETLGERHTTIIALHAELRHATASLTAEWRRLERMAQADLDAARNREASLRTADTVPDVKRRGAIDDARRTVQLADDAFARAMAASRDTAADERGYRVLLHPSIPSAATGFAPFARASMAGLAGLLVLGFGVGLRRRRDVASRRALVGVAEAGGEVVAMPDFAAKAEHGRAETRVEAPSPVSEDLEAQRVDEPTSRPEATSSTDDDARGALMQSMLDLLPQIETLVPSFGPVPTVMVSANETTTDTTGVALALGRAAVGCGHRVLLIEATRARAKLAAVADTDADPILLDFFGTLRVVLPAAAGDGALFIAPNLQQGARIASALARAGDAPLVDDLGAEFDLVLIDGGRAADAAAAGWGADAYLRVGRYRSKRDDDLFAAALGISQAASLGAVVDSSIAEPAAKAAFPTPRGATASARPANRTSSLNAAAAAPIRHAPPRRRIGAR